MNDQLEDCFSPQERHRGEPLAPTVMISSSSDTNVRATVKNVRVTLSAEDVSSETFNSQCTCTTAGKGILCKHIWAVVLKLEERESDFLQDKTTTGIDLQSAMKADTKKQELKERQATFRKAAYEKQKARAKEIKTGKAAPKPGAHKTAFAYPQPVEEAREYFAKNGFELAHPLEMEDAINARKLLARVFHPDKGGTHDEVLELNEHFDTIREYLES